jgi:4-hydroxy-tetrahydrodipicolinate synthase
MKDFKWEGVFPAITTNFNKDFTIDFQGFEKKLLFQMEAGVHGIILGGTLGEASALNNKEKSELIKVTRNITGDRLPVVINIAEQTTDAAINAAKEAEKNHADGLMMLPPMRYNADADETVAYFAAVAKSTSLPIMIYNNPVDYKILVTLDMFEELTKYPNIQAVKESTRDITNVTRMINRFKDRYRILCGVDTVAVESMVMGAVGWVAGLVCAFPKETVAIYEWVKNGKIDMAVELFRWFLPLLELDIHPKLVQNIKLAESEVGIGTETTRPPRLPLQGKERELVLGTIRKCLDNRPKI